MKTLGAYLVRLARKVVVTLDGPRNARVQVSEAGILGVVHGEAEARTVRELEVELAEFAAGGDFCLGTYGGDELVAEVWRPLVRCYLLVLVGGYW
jgi:hypothetical protein